MEKKIAAKAEMLKALSKEMSDDQFSPLKEKLNGKKLNKVTIMSDSEEGLKKGLSKAEQIMKMKGMHSPESCEEEMEDESSESEESEDMSEASEEELSPEQMKELIKTLKAKLGEE